MDQKEVSIKFVCGTCAYNDCGFCDMLGILVEDDDKPHCAYGKDWTGKAGIYYESSLSR